MRPKPAHLGPRYAAQFADPALVALYETRPPYPEALFPVLHGLRGRSTPRVLDLGCGTAALARGLLASGPSDLLVDAVDPSAPMLELAQTCEGGDDPRIHWHPCPAEAFDPPAPYGLVVAGESIHWMEWSVVFPWLVTALAPDGMLALVYGRDMRDVPWGPDLLALIPQYSTNQEYAPYDIVEELTSRGLFELVGTQRTAPQAHTLTVEDYIATFHTRNGFSPDRMTPEAREAFDAAVRTLVTPFAKDGRLTGVVQADIVWGRPLS